MVQLHESSAIERTGYNPAPTTSHYVQISGLLPSRDYTFSITSTDPAGNAATVETNSSGLPLAFSTLTPVALPWGDDMESGGPLWEIQSESYTEQEWTLGTPNNSLASSAHSPANAWGCNLNGTQNDIIETSLISPAINLTDVSSAELEFWHNYSFSEDIFQAFELGALELYTELGEAPVTLADYSGDSGGWTQETINLTPYVGQVVYLVWHYAYFKISFDSLDSPGWLVDDVAISASPLVPGTITVSNNLSQGSFVISGPITRNGSGSLAVIEYITALS